MSVGSFFRPQSTTSLQPRLNGIPKVELSTPRVLLFGPERCGKTSLLFNFALHLASQRAVGQQQQEVWFLCDHATLDQRPPVLLAADQQSEALSRIKFKYLSDLQQLKNFGACLHLAPNPPAAIIVDNIAHLTKNTKVSDKRAQDVVVTKALAVLADALEHLREQRGVDVLLLVSDSTAREGSPQNMYLLQRWFPVMLSVTGGGVAGHKHSLQVSIQSSQLLPQAALKAAVHYTLTQSYISVDAVQDGSYR